MANCSISGLSRPYFASIISTVFALARSVLNGPPGIIFIRKNVIVAMINSVNIAASTLFTINLATRNHPPHR